MTENGDGGQAEARAAYQKQLETWNALAREGDSATRASLTRAIRAASFADVILAVASQGGPIVEVVEQLLWQERDIFLARGLLQVLPTDSTNLLGIALAVHAVVGPTVTDPDEDLRLRSQRGTWLHASGFFDQAAAASSTEAGLAWDVPEAPPDSGLRPGAAEYLRSLGRQFIDHRGSAQCDAAMALARHATHLVSVGRTEEALLEVERAARLASRLAGFRSRRNLLARVFVLGTVGYCHGAAGELVVAEASTREAIALLLESEGAEQWREWLRSDAEIADIGRLRNQLGSILLELERPAEALREFETAEAIYQRYADEAPDEFSLEHARTIMNRARATSALGHGDAARQEYASAVALLRGGQTPAVRRLRAHVLLLWAGAAGATSEAEALYSEALEALAGIEDSAVCPEDHVMMRGLVFRSLLAESDAEVGADGVERAALGWEKTLQVVGRLHHSLSGPDDSMLRDDWGIKRVVEAMLEHGTDRFQRGDHGASTRIARRALDVCERLTGARTLRLRVAALALIARAQRTAEDHATAADAVCTALGLLEEYAQQNPFAHRSLDFRRHVAECHELAGSIHASAGKHAAAMTALREATDAFSAIGQDARARACMEAARELGDVGLDT